MVKQVLSAITVVLLLSSCSAIKPLNFTSNKQVSSVSAPENRNRFIEDIAVTPSTEENQQASKPAPHSAIASNRGPKATETSYTANDQTVLNRLMASRNAAEVESASPVQLKYAVLMNTEVEALPSKNLLESVDEWYGVRYRTGGNTKTGVDCSGFTVAVYMAVYGIALPRVSRDQYRISRKISTTELQEGDLVFFNTKGSGVSHVGVYLGNNKFMHASVSRGVMVSDLFEPYYLQRFYGAGRIEEKQLVSAKN